MSLITPIPPATPLPLRLVLRLPVLGWIARDVLYGDADNAWYAFVIALTALILAVMTWGLPALVLTAVASVPVIFTLLVLISWG